MRSRKRYIPIYGLYYIVNKMNHHNTTQEEVRVFCNSSDFWVTASLHALSMIGVIMLFGHLYNVMF